VRNSRDRHSDGTLICGESPVGIVKAIAHRLNGTHAVVGCVGDGLSNGGAASLRQTLREVDPLLEWQSTAACNLVATVERERVQGIVRQVHERIFGLPSRHRTERGSAGSNSTNRRDDFRLPGATALGSVPIRHYLLVTRRLRDQIHEARRWGEAVGARPVVN
jgi:hypothetical protein